MIAVVPVRTGTLPLGADETVAECGGDVLLVGDGCAAAASELRARTTRVRGVEAGPFAPGTWAGALAPLLREEDVVVLPASADGRDLAPRLAARLGRPLWAGAVAVSAQEVTLARHGDRVLATVALGGPAVATLVPGVAGLEPAPPEAEPPAYEEVTAPPSQEREPDAEVLAVLPASAATMDLSEAPRVVAGGAGLGSREGFERLAELAARLDGCLGATRVAVDRGWSPTATQIGTTGVVVKPELYVAVGVSGAAQHLGGVEQPKHTIAVNLDASCPMMAAADLAVVADGPAVVEALVGLLEGENGG